MNGALVALGVAVFGGLGSVCRFSIHRSITREHPADFPLGTFIANIGGAFLIGALHGAGASSDFTTIAGLGFLGGFTTFSTWMFESERLAVDGYAHGAVRNIAFSTAIGFLAVTLGVAIGRAL